MAITKYRVYCHKYKTTYKYALLTQKGKLSFSSEQYTNFDNHATAFRAIQKTANHPLSISDFTIEPVSMCLCGNEIESGYTSLCAKCNENVTRLYSEL